MKRVVKIGIGGISHSTEGSSERKTGISGSTGSASERKAGSSCLGCSVSSAWSEGRFGAGGRQSVGFR